MTPKLSVIAPVYNERENILPLLTELEAVLQSLRLSFEVILVDDGSQDGSFELMEQLAAEKDYLRVIRFRSNFGQTAAFDAGFRHASGEIVVTLDADVQNDPRDIPILLSRLEGGGYDFVAGWRRKRHDDFWRQVFPSRIANLIIRRVTGTQFHDLGCSLRAYRREILEDLRLYGEMHRFISVLLEANGARGVEVEVHHRPRSAGRSKYGLTRTFKVLLDLVTVWFLKGYRTKPIYIFGGMGSGCLALSVLLLGIVIWEKLVWLVKIHRNPLFVGSIFLSIVGIQFLALGLLAELIIRSSFESRDKPPYWIARTIGFDRSADKFREADVMEKR